MNRAAIDRRGELLAVPPAKSSIYLRAPPNIEAKPIAVTYLPISVLKLDPRNPRAHSKRQVRQIARSIGAFGFNVPVLIDAFSPFLSMLVHPRASFRRSSATTTRACLIPEFSREAERSPKRGIATAVCRELSGTEPETVIGGDRRGIQARSAGSLPGGVDVLWLMGWVYIRLMPMVAFIDPRTNPDASLTGPIARTTNDPGVLTELHRLCRDNRFYEVERWIQAGRPLQAGIRQGQKMRRPRLTDLRPGEGEDILIHAPESTRRIRCGRELPRANCRVESIARSLFAYPDVAVQFADLRKHFPDIARRFPVMMRR